MNSLSYNISPCAVLLQNDKQICEVSTLKFLIWFDKSIELRLIGCEANALNHDTTGMMDKETFHWA